MRATMFALVVLVVTASMTMARLDPVPTASRGASEREIRWANASRLSGGGAESECQRHRASFC